MIGEIVKRLRRVTAGEENWADIYEIPSDLHRYERNKAAEEKDAEHNLLFVEAFLDPAPVTEDWLREIGGVKQDGGDWSFFHGEYSIVDVTSLEGSSGCSCIEIFDTNGEGVCRPIKTRGSLLAILFGLKLGPFAEEAERRIAEAPNA